MVSLRKIPDPFFVFFIIFLSVNAYFLANTIACVELTSAFLLLFVMPSVTILGLILNILYHGRNKTLLLQILRYANLLFIIVTMAWYWLVYNTCNTFGNSIS